MNKNLKNFPGLWVVFLGPDGAGKTAIINALHQKLASSFNGIEYFHLRPYTFCWTRNTKNQTVLDPHGSKPRGFIFSSIKIIFFCIDYVFGYWIKLRGLRKKGALIFFDRHYYDLLIDPTRYRYNSNMLLPIIGGWIIPKPDLFIILDAPPELINARKSEVTLCETTRQREAYLRFAKEHRNSIILRTDKALKATISDALEAILHIHRNNIKVANED